MTTQMRKAEAQYFSAEESCIQNDAIFNALFQIILDDCLTVLECPVIELKSMLGTQLEILAQAASRHRNRIRELGQDNAPIKPTKALPRSVGLYDALREREDQLRQVLSDLQVMEAHIHAIWDAPSQRAIKRTIADLLECIERTSTALSAVPAELMSEQLNRKTDAREWRPARDKRFSIGAQPPKQSNGSHADTIVRVCHITLMGTEIPTIEACADLILDFHFVDWEFVVDMARQAWDEARHADSFLQKIDQLGGKIGAFPCDSVLWEMSRQDSLALRLCIHQRIGEWIGIDAAMGMAEDLRKKDDTATAMLLDYVARDEITHVNYGNRWIKQLLPNDEAVLALHEQAEEIRAAHNQLLTASNFPLMIDMCRRAGMSNVEIARLAEKHGFDAQVAAQ